MNRWLALFCMLSILGGAYSYYTPISVGANALTTMSTSLKTISTTVGNYYVSLNLARTKIFAALNDLTQYVNVTYGAFNTTYGANQPLLNSFMSTVGYLNQSVAQGDNQVTQGIINDFTSLSQYLQQSIDTILQSFSSLSSITYNTNGDNCTLRNATQMANVPNDLVNLGTCLQVESDQITAIVPNVLNIIGTVKSDLILLNNQLKICSSQSPSCITEYFNELWQEYSAFQMELYLLQSVVSSAQQDATDRNRFCGDLTKADVQDDIQNLMMAVSSCMYPSS
ncbi:uncharacterized protein LOC129723114 [Wyeomyia smithii]|uniref:uncharacterized protein LOC129723114 n=1 Tax=Wyeomyia smithii TaxID=174621 RepID=UPI002467F27D|nr:uncharacterized protein LOC129723114 [Wyeomyia smithii]